MATLTKQSTVGMSREEWEEARMGTIGGSDAAAVVGLTPYKSPYALWAEKTGAIIPDNISGKEAVRLGNYLESYVAERFTEETGLKVRRENAILRNDEYPFAHANVDRMVVGMRSGLECKTTSALNLKKFSGGEYPANYYCQCMHYMAVTGYDTWYLAVLIGNQDFRIYKIERNEDEIQALMEAERDFWQCVQSNTPPAADGMESTGEVLQQIYQSDPQLPEVDLTPVCGSLRQYLALKAEIKRLESRIEVAANEIKAYMKNATKGSYDGLQVNWSQTQTKRFDKAAFHKKNPSIDLSEFHKTTFSRRFEVKETT